MRHKYLAKEDAPSSTPSPVWAQENAKKRDVTVGKLRTGADKTVTANPGDMVFTTDLHGGHASVLSKSEFDKLYTRMP